MIRYADMHNDFLTMSPSPAAYIQKVPADTVVTAAVWTTEVCADVADVTGRAARISGDPRFLLAIEDCGCIGIEEVGLLSGLGVCCAGLTWNGENRYGGGAYCRAGLTTEGVTFCRSLDAHGIFTDTAHMNDETFYGVYDLGIRILDSHTAFYDCFRHKRAISFDRVSKILKRGGKVGLTLVSEFFGGSVAVWTREADAFVQRYGVDGLCIGTDFWGSGRYVSDELRNDYENLSILVEKLRRMGYNENDLRKIFADNYLSLWRNPLCTNSTTTP